MEGGTDGSGNELLMERGRWVEAAELMTFVRDASVSEKTVDALRQHDIDVPSLVTLNDAWLRYLLSLPPSRTPLSPPPRPLLVLRTRTCSFALTLSGGGS